MLAQETWPVTETQISCQHSPDQEAKLLDQYSHLVKRAASHLRSLLGTVVDQDDIQQVGLLGLLTAIRRYGKHHDAQFEAYAFKCVRGAMLDEFRRTDWRPRQLRSDAHKLRDVERTLTKELGKAPSEALLCEQLNIDKQTLTELRYVLQAESIESLNEILEQQGESVLPFSNTNQDMSLALKQAIGSLPERQRLLLHLYYNHDLNMKEIALVMQLTESRVCQLHKLAIDRLIFKLSDN